MVYVDAHCHAYEFEEEEITNFTKEIFIAAVSDDLESSYKTIKLASKHKNIVPCIGIHPWEIGKTSREHLEEILTLIVKFGVKCLGEVGLDRKFTPETIDRQREFFNFFLQLARDYELSMNIHAAHTWKEVLDLLRKYEIEKAVFHWYTGPLELIDEITSSGYMISINPAYKIQEKHRKVIEHLNLEYMLTESDGPYSYRGLMLNPEMIKDTVLFISNIKRIQVNELIETLHKNFVSIFFK